MWSTQRLILAIALGLLLAAGLLTWAERAQAAPAQSITTVLYNGALGGTPNSQGYFDYQAINLSDPFAPVSATQTYSNGATVLDSLPQKSELAGYSTTSPGGLSFNRTAGFQVIFTAQVISETHAGSDRNSDGIDDRAGFSVTVVGQDKRGIELGFWMNRIWAQEGGIGQDLFSQAEGAVFNTTSGLITYTLTISGDTYALTANNSTILSGATRDYTGFVGPLDPYETPNFLFLGDNSSSAQAQVKIKYVDIQTPHFFYLPLVIKSS